MQFILSQTPLAQATEERGTRGPGLLVERAPLAPLAPLPPPPVSSAPPTEVLPLDHLVRVREQVQVWEQVQVQVLGHLVEEPGELGGGGGAGGQAARLVAVQVDFLRAEVLGYVRPAGAGARAGGDGRL